MTTELSLSHRVLHHDWLSETLPLIVPCDLVVADPPYNIGIKYSDDPTRDSLPPDQYHAAIVQRPILSLIHI